MHPRIHSKPLKSYDPLNNRSSLWGAFIFLALLHVLFFTLLSSIILFPFLSIHGAANISSFPFFPICIFFYLFRCLSCVTIMIAIIPLNDIGPLVLLSKSFSISSSAFGSNVYHSLYSVLYFFHFSGFSLPILNQHLTKL